MTAALEQAAFLRALASHLAHHPDLPDVIVHYWRYQLIELQLKSNDARDFHAWADSLDGATVQIGAVEDDGGCHVLADADACIGRRRIRLWGYIPRATKPPAAEPAPTPALREDQPA